MRPTPGTFAPPSTLGLAPILRLLLGSLFVVFAITIAGCKRSALSVEGVDNMTVLPVAGETILYDDTQWPTLGTTMSSPFGPRLKASEDYRYDFHRGIDIPDDRGTPVFAIADGEVFRTYFEGDPGSSYPGGGNVIITRHTPDTPIPFHGTTHNRYYALYLHLDTILVDAATPGGPYEQIQKGDQIGTVGQSGETTFNHLHFEIRIGTTCSREYQQSHPDAACASYFGDEPQDPHVNPLLFLDYAETDSFEVMVMRENPLKIRVRSDRDELDFNEIRVLYRSTEKIINLNDRTGIDPSDIDNSAYDGVVISPARFSSRSDLYEITFEFEDLPRYASIEVRDIHGKGVLILANKPPDSWPAQDGTSSGKK